MKLIKRLIYGLLILCMLLCGSVVVCALIPGLTDKIAIMLYKESPADGTEQDPLPPVYTISGSTTAGINWENMPFADQEGYVIPGRDQISTPTESVGKNDYQGIDGSTSQIQDPEAEQLKQQLGIGELGSGLQFNELFYPYYAMLTEPMQQLYRQIYANAESLNDSFQPVTDVNSDQLYTVFEAVIGDHPELFWLETGYSCRCQSSGKVVEITLKYYDISKRIDSARQEFNSAAEEILSQARSLGTDLEKERFIHDALIRKDTYQKTAKMNQSAYSALVEGKTVCAGYARAFQYLMLQMGIPCYYCTGYSGEDHAWDIVFVDGLYRNVDVTWDDTETDTYRYFNCSDKALAGTHMRKGLSVYLPACPEEGSSASLSPMDGLEGLINPNPIKPLTLADSSGQRPGGVQPTAKPAQTPAVSEEENLREAGISESDVLRSLDAYYKDCGEQLKKAGTGQVYFSNCIPSSLWESIENAYASKKHLAGYVDDALKELKVDNFAINLQVVKLGGGYYKLYHTIATW